MQSPQSQESPQTMHASNAIEQPPVLPQNREWIEVQANKFVSINPPREITRILHSMFDGPWSSWKHIPEDSRKILFDRFKQYFQWDSEADISVLKAWEEIMKALVKEAVHGERKAAIAMAKEAGLDADADMSLIIPYCPTWIKEVHWVQMVQKWNTPKWKKLSKVNTKNKESNGSIGKHTTGSVSFLVTKIRREKEAGQALPWSNHYINFHITKSSREAAAAGTREPKFVSSKSKRVLEDYLKGMADKYGSDHASHPIGDFEVWGRVAKRSNTRGLLGVGEVSDPGYVVTDQSTTHHASSIVPSGAASANEVLLLKEQIEEQKQNAIAREDAFQKEIEELRKRNEEREEEMRRRDEERDAHLRTAQEALEVTKQETKKEMEDMLAAFERRFLSRDHPPRV